MTADATAGNTAKRFITWLLEDKTWRSFVAILGIVLLFSLGLALAIAVPVDRKNDALAERCTAIGAQPVKVRAWVKFCELPDGSLVTIP